MREAQHPSQTSVLTTAPRRNIPEDANFHSQRSGNFKFYSVLECLSSLLQQFQLQSEYEYSTGRRGGVPNN
jgi:hypothetical protein